MRLSVSEVRQALTLPCFERTREWFESEFTDHNEELRKRYTELLAVVKQEYEEIVKNEVQRAISADEQAIKRLSANYIDNVKAYTQKEKVKNPYTGQDEEPDERLMRSIESKIDIPESRKDDFRREIMNYIGALAVEGKTFSYDTNERLIKAEQKSSKIRRTRSS